MELNVVKKMLSANITPGNLALDETLLVDASGKKAYHFILEFFNTHRKLPSEETVEHECGVDLKSVISSEPIEYYIGQLQKRDKLNRVGKFIKWSINSLDKDGDPDKVVDIMRGLIRDMTTSVVGGMWDISRDEDRRKVLEDYENVKKLSGKTPGIETPWSFVNEEVGGIQKGQFISIIAKSATGKTWVLLAMATHAYKQGKRVLFFSAEMPQEVIRYRFAAVHEKLSYRAFRKGLLTSHEEDRLRKFAEGPFQQNFIITDASRVQSSDQIAALVAEYNPDLVIVDSYYLLDSSMKYGSTNERREALTIEMHNQSKRLKVPYIVSTHFSSQGKNKDKKGDIEDVGYTKQATRLADVAFGLFRDEEMRANGVILLQLLKHREGVSADIVINFDLDRMNFDQIKVENTISEYGSSSGGGGGGGGAPAPPTQQEFGGEDQTGLPL